MAGLQDVNGMRWPQQVAVQAVRMDVGTLSLLGCCKNPISKASCFSLRTSLVGTAAVQVAPARCASLFQIAAEGWLYCFEHIFIGLILAKKSTCCSRRVSVVPTQASYLTP